MALQRDQLTSRAETAEKAIAAKEAEHTKRNEEVSESLHFPVHQDKQQHHCPSTSG